MTIKIDCDSELFKALLALSVDLILTNAREKKKLHPSKPTLYFL